MPQPPLLWFNRSRVGPWTFILSWKALWVILSHIKVGNYLFLYFWDLLFFTYSNSLLTYNELSGMRQQNKYEVRLHSHIASWEHINGKMGTYIYTHRSESGGLYGGQARKVGVGITGMVLGWGGGCGSFMTHTKWHDVGAGGQKRNAQKRERELHAVRLESSVCFC